jgi:hypothetical protein
MEGAEGGEEEQFDSDAEMDAEADIIKDENSSDQKPGSEASGQLPDVFEEMKT